MKKSNGQETEIKMPEKFDFKDLNFNYKLNTKTRWLLAILMMLSFLFSIFGTMMFFRDSFLPFSAIMFWILLWLAWPVNVTKSSQKILYVFVQLILAGVFLFLSDVFGKYIFEASVIYLRVFYIFIVIGWFHLSRRIFYRLVNHV